MDIESRENWSLLRYNYYSAGRNEMLLGNYAAAGILLGYAIETSFKHALIEAGFQDLAILKKHEPQLLYATCKKEGILNGIESSDDLLEYINDHLKPRYPILQRQVSEDIISKNRINIIGPLLLSWYDDLMYEIDTWILSYTKDSLSSCFFRGSGEVKSLKGKLFFHANYHACHQIDNYIVMRKNHKGENSEVIDELEKGVENLWSQVTGIIPAQDFRNVKYYRNFSKRFHYAKWSSEEKPRIVIRTWNCVMINLLPWELDIPSR
ncbi:hypothetical protein JWG45_03525 [Leptospira sp. 201903070]|uniref:Uncharacterized protein n=1 Tax=Leptospira ainlahdjerensis TaxID=2810033 RepID=A0ABS2U770_9LEPT|nr:hypothetical protein [Leptospira ainlahdjerensis]MBM9576216.1 hypothetical protein [Leptospira ainlahdjerensis]